MIFNNDFITQAANFLIFMYKESKGTELKPVNAIKFTYQLITTPEYARVTIICFNIFSSYSYRFVCVNRNFLPTPSIWRTIRSSVRRLSSIILMILLSFVSGMSAIGQLGRARKISSLSLRSSYK